MPEPVQAPTAQPEEQEQVASVAPPVASRPHKREFRRETAPAVRAQSRIRKIFVASLGDGDGPDMLREKIAHTLEQNHFVVVDRAEAADAVLSGSGSWANLRVKKFHARLVDGGQRVLWSGDVSSGGWVRSASSSVADKLVENLMNALAYPDEQP